ncbi:carboxypeptidase-like regulatory domain-containing protein [Amycolatopsis sp. MtRt-6]|uniref:carboxypeptidase-like regulatory domain-containing protein n=1 Tax=Amycolatopsis sp. MtRt-6 TaxID=2792782 RepID=UPI001F5D3F70|nr:carboxypeptidase-like regulatory domain-containing protein [Amycolatopsis sp. MtRt-6]
MGYFAAATDGDDIQPVEDFSMPPAADTPRGTLTGTVTDQDSGAPIAGVTVAFGGHASGFAGGLVATTAADGTYTISGILPGTSTLGCFFISSTELAVYGTPAA